MTESSDSPRAALVSVGDELLLGRTVDTNSAWLAAELATMGLPVIAGHVVGDVEADIRRVVREALSRAEVTIVTGGLGPTPDDRTRSAVAALLDRALDLDPDLLEGLERRFAERGFGHLPQSNIDQALVPVGALVLPNERGTAPGLAMEEGRRLVILLPGVPLEMKGIFDDHVRGLLQDRWRGRLTPVLHRTIHTTGIAESELADRTVEVLSGDLGPVSVAFLPDVTGVDLRLTARGIASGSEARIHLDRVEAMLAPVVSRYRFESESGDVVEALANALAVSGRRLAVAESCTGGLIAKRLTDRPGASEFFIGAIVAYSDAVKVEALGVDPGALARAGAVSREVVVQMARGVCARMGAQASVAITGIAGPGGGSDDKPAGTVWHAACVDDDVEARLERFMGGRDAVRGRSAQAALALLLRSLERSV